MDIVSYPVPFRGALHAALEREKSILHVKPSHRGGHDIRNAGVTKRLFEVD
jgi:hypothetical protein